MTQETLPKMSYGNDIDDPEAMVFRVDEGRFAGTIFKYGSVGFFPVGQDKFTVNYEVDFLMFSDAGVISESPGAEVLQEFYSTIATPNMEMIIEAGAEAKELPEEDG